MQSGQGCYGVASRPAYRRSFFKLDTFGGLGSTNTSVVYWSTITKVGAGNDIVYQPSSTLGDSFLIKSDGVYFLQFTMDSTAAAAATQICFSIDCSSSDLTAAPLSMNANTRYGLARSPVGTTAIVDTSTSITLPISANSIVRFHMNNGSSSVDTPARSSGFICKVGD